MKKFNLIPQCILLIFFLLACNTNSQVDQRWLKHWNEAQKTKPSHIPSISRIAPVNEPGIPFVIQGRIFNPDGTPAIGVLVHSYHRDTKGYDFVKNDVVFPTWRLQGWAKTDRNGKFEFKTIRPGADYIGRDGPHIHFTTISTKYGKQWAPTIFLSDDTKHTKKQRLASKKAGKFGWIVKVRKIKGIQHIKVYIQLKERSDF